MTGKNTLLTYFLLAAFAVTDAAADIGDKPIGKTLYERYCSSCHGLSGKGDGPVTSSLRVAPADLTRIANRRGGKFPESEIVAIIDGRNGIAAHGLREMPVWGRIFSESAGGDSVGEEYSQGNVLVLIDYLRSIQK